MDATNATKHLANILFFFGSQMFSELKGQSTSIYYRKPLEFLGKTKVFRLSLDIIAPLLI